MKGIRTDDIFNTNLLSKNIRTTLHNYNYNLNFIRVVIFRTADTTNHILGDHYSLLSIETIKKFKLNIDAYYIMYICSRDKVDILEWWLKSSKKSGLELKYDEDALYFASKNGHVNVLDWWLKSGLELKYDADALRCASANGHVNVLEWWLRSGLELKYCGRALFWASWMNQVDVLDWWFKSGLTLKYDNKPIDFASHYGCIEALECWLKSSKKFGLKLKYGKINLNVVKKNVRKWWLKSGLDLKN